MHSTILGLSILLQVAAAVLSLRIGWLSRRRAAWLLIGVAIILMSVRRSVTFLRMLTDLAQPDLLAEVIALTISACLLLGLWRVRPDLRTLRDAADRENRLGEILEGSLNEIFVFDFETLCFLLVNRGARENLGYSMEELGSLTPVDIKPEFDRESFEKLIAPLRDGSTEVLHITTSHLRKDGSQYPVEVNLQVSQNTDPRVFFAVIADISGRQRIEAERHRLWVALEQADEGITVLDADTRVEYANARFAELMQQPAHRLTGRKFDDLGEQAAAGLAREVYRGLRTVGAWRGRWTDRVDGEDRGVYYAAFRPIKDLEDAAKGFVGVVRDVTREAKLERELLHAQKMEAVGQLAGGVAHDFNNLLTVIGGYADCLVDELRDQTGLHGDALEIVRAADQAALLTRQLLTFSRQGPSEQRPFDLNRRLKDTAKILRRLIEENTEIEIQTDSGECCVEMDPGHFEQAVMNLVINARDAMPEGGRVVITLRNESFLPGSDLPSPQLGYGHHIVLTVSDSGEGMDEETQRRIFEPFFTTKKKGKGTGLGLATVYGIVHATGGAIRVESSPGHGTTFELFMPRYEGKLTGDSPPASGSGQIIDCESVLLVEDDDAVRELAAKLLEDRGLRVSQAENGEQALELLELESFQLVITDYIMPRMSGPELIERIRARVPEIRVLLISGYMETIRAPTPHEPPWDAFLAKPFSLTQLSDAVHEALEVSSPSRE